MKRLNEQSVHVKLNSINLFFIFANITPTQTVGFFLYFFYMKSQILLVHQSHIPIIGWEPNDSCETMSVLPSPERKIHKTLCIINSRQWYPTVKTCIHDNNLIHTKHQSPPGLPGIDLIPRFIDDKSTMPTPK